MLKKECMGSSCRVRSAHPLPCEPFYCRQQPTTVHSPSQCRPKIHAHKNSPRAQKIPTPPPPREESVRRRRRPHPLGSLYTGGAVNPSHPSHLTAAALVPFLPPSLSPPPVPSLLVSAGGKKIRPDSPALSPRPLAHTFSASGLLASDPPLSHSWILPAACCVPRRVYRPSAVHHRQRAAPSTHYPAVAATGPPPEQASGFPSFSCGPDRPIHSDLLIPDLTSFQPPPPREF
jgi:hypothetical protein